MNIRSLTPVQATALAVQTLGLDAATIDLSSSEAVAASLMRASSFLCPASPTRIVTAVLDALRPLMSEAVLAREDVLSVLDLVIAAGHLLELRHDEDGRSTRLIFLGPPSFIEREPGTYLLLGVRPFGQPLLEHPLSQMVEPEGQTRVIHLDPGIADRQLSAAGLQRIDRQRWVASPRVELSGELIGRVSSRLDAAGSGGEIEGLRILDPASPVRYYAGRWRPATSADNGDFIARRPQAYGADLWSALRLVAGRAEKLMDFPVDDPAVPARDEAWRLQMAVDANRNLAQRYLVELGNQDDYLRLKFFSPIPGFAERYLQLVGLPLMKVPGALMTFRVPVGAMPGVRQMLHDLLWMSPEEKDGKHDS